MDIKLLAATKTVSPELINYGLEKGIELIGENRVQELLSKRTGLTPIKSTRILSDIFRQTK